MIDYLANHCDMPSRRKKGAGLGQSGKTQAEKIELLKSKGWHEDQGSRDIRRWREPRTKALYSLHDAFSLIQSRDIAR